MAAHTGPTPDEDRLRDIRSLTDAALSRLDDRDFLAELLDRAKEILQADTAAVLLLDYAAGQLIATAAAGLEGLARLCQAVTTQPAEDVCASVMSTLVGADAAHDDIALLAFRRQPEASEELPSGKAGRR
jgi:hypothetical protein